MPADPGTAERTGRRATPAGDPAPLTARDTAGEPRPDDRPAAGSDTDAPARSAAAADRTPEPDRTPPDDPPDENDPDDRDRPDDWDGHARWARPFLVVAAAVGLLLLGAAAGLLIGLPGADTASTPTADSVDVGFAQDMTVHHQQAVEMAAWERDHSADPVLGQLATDIESTQNAQIGRMQGWLSLWDAASLPVGGHMAWMSDPTHGHGGGQAVPTMPGMASPTDLAALRAATGPQLDVLWLQLMLRHHQGGAEMLEYASQHAAVPQVRNLAAQMLGSQASESEYLAQLLAQRGGQPIPL